MPKLVDIAEPFERRKTDLPLEEEGSFNQSWSTFFLNQELVVKLLREVSKEVVQKILSAGVKWTGSEGNTTRAAHLL